MEKKYTNLFVLLFFSIICIFIFAFIGETSAQATYTDCSIYGNCQSAKPVQPSNASANGTTYHNLLSGLQGGIAGEFYHLTSAVYNWVTNNLNNFWTKNETIVANLSGSYGYSESDPLSFHINETIVANLSGSYGYSELDPTLIKDENGAYVG